MFLSIFLIVLVGSFGKSTSSYLELSDNFSELRKNGGHWLIKFYAPWCGHCQRLEPVWAEVGDALIHTNIKVGRIDCSHFPKVASEFGIRGYPTIKFITSDSEHTFTGDRNKDEIVQFASRVAGPPIKEITSPKEFTELKQSKPLFFSFVGDKKGQLWETYQDVAKRFQPYSHFYVMDEETAKHSVSVRSFPSIFVMKEHEPIYFSAFDSITGAEIVSLNVSMSNWVNEERFGTYLKVSRGNFNELMQLNRYVVLAIVDEKKLHQDPAMLNFKEMVGNIVRTNKRKYRKKFIFGWVGNHDFANSLALDIVPLPYLLVINSTNHYHHIPNVEDCSKMIPEEVELFLETIFNQTAIAYGGNGFGTRLYRAYFEAKTALIEMWQGNPALTAVLFTIPVLFITFIFYSLCFADILDSDGAEEDGDEEEDIEEDGLGESHLKSE